MEKSRSEDDKPIYKIIAPSETARPFLTIFEDDEKRSFVMFTPDVEDGDSIIPESLGKILGIAARSIAQSIMVLGQLPDHKLEHIEAMLRDGFHKEMIEQSVPNKGILYQECIREEEVEEDEEDDTQDEDDHWSDDYYDC